MAGAFWQGDSFASVYRHTLRHDGGRLGGKCAAGRAIRRRCEMSLGHGGALKLQRAGGQRAGQEGVLFFVGRISAHDPGFDFARLKAMGQSMSAQAAQSELQQKCGPMLQRYMKQLETALNSSAPPASAPPAAH